MKKLLCVLFSLSLCLGAAACGGGVQPAPSAAPAQSAPAQSAESSGGQGGAGEKLMFWDMPWGGSDYTVEAKKLCARYAQETGVEVEYQQIPWDGWIQVFVTAVTSGAGPDVSTGGALLQHRLALMNEIEPLDDLAAQYQAADFVNGTMENFRYQDHQIAIPFNCDFRGMYYRTDLFEQAGITAAPKNWDEFYEAAKKLTAGGQYGYVTAGADVSGHWALLFWSVMNGGSYLDDSLAPNMANDANVQALDFLDKMYNEGIIPPGAAGYTGAEAKKVFFQGKAAMIMDAPGLADEIPDDMLGKVSLMEPLTSPAGLTQNVGSTNGIMLFADSQHKDAGKAFIDWWGKNTITLWSVGGMGPFPARLSLMEDGYFQESKFPKLFTERVVPKTVLLTYPHKQAAVEMDIMDGEQFYRDVIQELYTTDKDSSTILQEADERYQKALDQLHKSAA